MKKIIKFITFIFIIIALTTVYARYVGTYGFITKEYAVTDEYLPSGFDGLKIVHLSDIHYNRAITISKIKDIVKEINLIRPDIVVFTGDLVDKDVSLSDKDFNDLTNALLKIDAKYGKYAILGNHDVEYNSEKVIDVFNGSNFKYLDNESDIIFNKKNEKIFIGGLNSVSKNKDNISKMMEGSKDEDYKIILVHEPDISDKIVKDYKVNLILAGHSHNGQIRLPFIGALYTPPYAKEYYDNYYKINNTNLYISSGIGVSNINYRLFNKPSINFYRINKLSQ